LERKAEPRPITASTKGFARLLVPDKRLLETAARKLVSGKSGECVSECRAIAAFLG
jgi:hypothetical protein